MIKKLLSRSIGLVVLMLTGVLMTQNLHAQQIGGPYEADSATMLLLHFNGNLNNESQFSQDAVGHGTIDFQSEARVKDTLNQALRIQNSSPSDSSFVTVPHTDSLSLTGSWTIEGWINIFTFGEESGNYKWVPRLINKPGEEVFYTGNYYMEMWGSSRLFKVGYHTTAAGDGTWIEVNSPSNMLEVGSWYHWAYIRDAENNVLISVLHRMKSDGTMDRVFFGVNPYDPIAESPPLTNDNDVHIGFAGGGTDSFLDGWVDEIRISSVVRSFDIPPVFTSATELGNQSPDSSYTVTASAYKLGEGKQVQNVQVHYRTDTTGQFQGMDLSEVDTRTYSATIPSQSVGTSVEYYYSATDNDGKTAYYPNTAVSDSNYISFGIVDPTSQTLNLAFEEGSGAPVDSSAYGNTVELFGNASYSEDAYSGQYAMELSGDSATYVASESPFYSSETMQVEFWFKPDSAMVNNIRLAINVGSPWWQSNFEIRSRPGGAISGGSYVPGLIEPGPYMMNSMVLDSLPTPNAWNKVIYQVSQDTAIFQLFDENEQFVDEAIFTLDSNLDPVLTDGPLYIGGIPGSGTPYFDGTIDNFRMYNYAKSDLVVHTAIENENPADDLPNKVRLNENYPNPFNPTTTISYQLPSAQHIELTVYDLLGRKVATLVNGVKKAGRHNVTFDAQGLSSGVYLYRLETSDQVQTRKMLLVK